MATLTYTPVDDIAKVFHTEQFREGTLTPLLETDSRWTQSRIRIRKAEVYPIPEEAAAGNCLHGERQHKAL